MSQNNVHIIIPYVLCNHKNIALIYYISHVNLSQMLLNVSIDNYLLCIYYVYIF